MLSQDSSRSYEGISDSTLYESSRVLDSLWQENLMIKSGCYKYVIVGDSIKYDNDSLAIFRPVNKDTIIVYYDSYAYIMKRVSGSILTYDHKLMSNNEAAFKEFQKEFNNRSEVFKRENRIVTRE
jgi:hypothetical protein